MDLAEQIDDFIPSGQPSHSEMDSLIMLIFILVILSIFILWLGRFLYQKFVIKKAEIKIDESNSNDEILNEEKSSEQPQNSQQTTEVKTQPQPNFPKRSQSSSNLRKRITKKSLGAEIPKQRRSRSVPPPTTVSGTNEVTSLWTSRVFKWLYSDLAIVNDLLFGFITAINQTIARNTKENEILIEIVRLLPESTAPIITNIFCDKPQTVSEVFVTMNVDSTLVMQVKAFRHVSERTDVLHYRVSVKLRGNLSVAMNYTALIGEMRIEGKPDLKLSIAPIGMINLNEKNEKIIQDKICENLNKTFYETIYPIDFSVHASCPRAVRNGKNDYHSGFSYGRRLLVKIVKGEDLTFARNPFCVVEMDEPPQKNQTGSRQGSSPYWDEHFLFDLSNASSEILFEVYDCAANPKFEFPKFLGLGLVGVDEIAVGNSSFQKINLQSRPYENQDISGSIIVEFAFMEGPQVNRPQRIEGNSKIPLK